MSGEAPGKANRAGLDAHSDKIFLRGSASACVGPSGWL